MAGYWWFFSFILAILRPNGILVRHFGFAKESAAALQDVTKRIIVSVVLLLNTSIFSNVMDTGLANDVLGEINTIVALLFCIVIIAPRFVRTEKSLNSSVTDQRDRTLLKIMRVLLQLVPVILIALVALGYYYTALNLITHIINTYIAWVVWSLVRHTIYRGITVASRRLAYRRLHEKRQQKQQDSSDTSASDDVVVITEQEEGLALNEVRSQLLRFADLFIWTALFAIFYYVWSDLVTVVSYLRDITLWQQTSTTEAGVVTETSLLQLVEHGHSQRLGCLGRNYNGCLQPFPLVSVLVCKKSLQTLFPVLFYYLNVQFVWAIQ